MPPRDTDCARCGGRLERGFLPDFGQHGPSRTVNWVQGEGPQKRWWGTTVDGQLRYGIEAWRCRECGRLDLFAIEPEQ